MRYITWIVLLALICTGVARGADVKTLEIGAAAPDFDLPGIDRKNHRLRDYDNAKLLVIIFTCNHCPTAQAYEARIKQMYADYKDKGVALVAINPNNPEAVRLDELSYTDLGDSFGDMKVRAKDHGFEFPYLYDGETQKTAHAYGVIATPHVFIFDAQRKLQYVGGIDDSDVRQVKHTYARDAVEALLAGKPVPTAQTKVFGCSTKWIDKHQGATKAVEEWSKEAVSLDTIDAAKVKELVKNDSKKLRLINLWATWCGPCVAEMPELLSMQRVYRQRGFELVTISMDDPDKKDQALQFLKQRHLSSTNYIFSSDDRNALVDALDKEWQGPVPYTLLIAPGGKILYRHAGLIDPLELKREIVAYLGRTY